MDSFSEGYAAYGDGVPLDRCPYSDDPVGMEDRRAWLAGWREAERDNSQHGVGA